VGHQAHEGRQSQRRFVYRGLTGADCFISCHVTMLTATQLTAPHPHPRAPVYSESHNNTFNSNALVRCSSSQLWIQQSAVCFFRTAPSPERE